MATKVDFTEDEWETLRQGITGAGMLVSIGVRDFTDTFGERSASARSARPRLAVLLDPPLPAVLNRRVHERHRAVPGSTPPQGLRGLAAPRPMR